ncbi:phospholipase/Carboxylesteras-like protein [Microthyrium microscopicum]|uniref:Phospholipase/Carboxylesteras-like protein n=1 Tax=Microthyrium microscopicum TaxID=703497 RepID=A0A6A6U2U0_9PEZI|nr:phospholipase/Carboxylesteras-like protein [Microthyrium microscopicum]
MAPMLPKTRDFPESVTLSVVPPPTNHPPTNVLILLHGLGDSHAPFASFGKAMNLPETVCVSVRGPAMVPFGLSGFHWGDDILVDDATGDMEMDTGFNKSTALIIDDVIQKTLVQKCGYTLRQILIYGFGQGGMLALNVANNLQGELAGVISIGSGMPSSKVTEVRTGKCKTPVLLCKASDESAVEVEDEDKLKAEFDFVEIKEWNRVRDGMPRSREEMLPIMQFFARRLQSMRGVPQGSVELN